MLCKPRLLSLAFLALFALVACRTGGRSSAAASPPGALVAMREFIAANPVDKSNPDWRTSVKKPPQLTFERRHEYFWLLNTSEGPLKIRLMPDIAPMHVSSTIYLTELGFYDGLAFHRVMTGFIAQGGDPLGTGRGGPAYKYAGEFSRKVKHTKPGLLSMANTGPFTDGSQFFLTFAATPKLDGLHTIFGEIVEGMDSLRRIERHGSANGRTSKALLITTAQILTR